MTVMLIFFFFLALGFGWMASIPQFSNYQYTLGSNLVVNGDFQLPHVAGSWLPSRTMPSWTCTSYFQIDTISIYPSLVAPPNNWPSPNQFVQVDAYSNQNYTHQIILDTQYYVLSYNFATATTNYNTAQMQIWFNFVILQNLLPKNTTWNSRSVIVQGNYGTNYIMFQGTGPSDGSGMKLDNVQLQLITFVDSQTQTNVQNILLITSHILANDFPGSRVIFTGYSSLMLSLDHFFLYSYHKRKYSCYALYLMTDAQIILQGKGKLFFSSVAPNSTILSQNINFQKAYTNNIFLSVRSISYGLIANSLSIIAIQYPSILLVFSFFALIFYILKKSRLSSLLRQYSLIGTLILMLIEGNIQQTTFFFLTQACSFFSTMFSQKILHVISLIFFFTFFTAALTIYLLTFAHYAKLARKHCLQRMKSNLKTCLFLTRKSLFSVALGFAHAILLSLPNTQIIVLASIQFCHSLFLIICFKQNKLKIRLRILFQVFLSWLRIVFIVSFYFYDNNFHLRIDLSRVHFYWLISYIGLFLLFAFYQIVLIFINVGQRILRVCKKRKRLYKIANTHNQNDNLIVKSKHHQTKSKPLPKNSPTSNHISNENQENGKLQQMMQAHQRFGSDGINPLISPKNIKPLPKHRQLKFKARQNYQQ